jgi:hypothetical protein
MDGKKKKKNTEEETPGYEDLLDGFAFEEKKGEENPDLDGLALSQLLGEDGELRMPGEKTKSGMFDSIAADEYADFAKQFEEIDLTALTIEGGEGKKTPSEEEAAVETEPSEKAEENPSLADSSEYASILSQMDGGSDAESAGEASGEFGLEDLRLEEMPEILDSEGEGRAELLSALDTASELPSLVEEDSAVEAVDQLHDEALPPIGDTPSLSGEEATADSSQDSDAASILSRAFPEQEQGMAADSSMDEEMAAMYAGILSADEETASAENSADSDEVSMIAEGLSVEEEPPADTVSEEDAMYASALEDMLKEPGDAESSGEPPEMLPDDKGGAAADEVSVESLFEKEEPPSVEAAAEPPAAEEEHDFLGLGGLGGNIPKTASKKKSGSDVLFEGVEMDFEEQIAQVTLAELLLAQGKKKEAADLFLEVSKRKGVTHWVAKRLRLLTSNQ